MKTVEYQGVVRRVMAGRAEVEIQSAPVSEPGIAHERVGRIVFVNCSGREVRSGERVVLVETVLDQGLVMFLGLFLPVLMCVVIYFVFRQVTQGDDRLSLTVAAVFLFPYYSILLLMKKYLHKEHTYRLKQ